MRGVVFLVLCLVFSEVLNVDGAVYKVGDASGWTTLGNVNYTAWAFDKTFQIGDVIVFEYNRQFHNVMQVTHAEYRACNVSNPISTYTTGNDTITIQNRGHHFYLCGVAGHCQSGQKVDINVLAAVAPHASSPSGVPSTAPPSIVPAPSGSDAARPRVNHMQLGWVILQVLVLAFYFGI